MCINDDGSGVFRVVEKQMVYSEEKRTNASETSKKVNRRIKNEQR